MELGSGGSFFSLYIVLCFNITMSLRNKLYKEILQKKRELDDARRKGLTVRVEKDLPRMAAGCEYAGVEECGFSSHSKHVRRPDIHYPFFPLLEKALKAQAPNISQDLPFVVFKPKRQQVHNSCTGKIQYKRIVDKFVGTCAEDNACNSLLYSLKPGQVPVSLKNIIFVHPVRTRTLKRERMCVVCRNIFSEP